MDSLALSEYLLTEGRVAAAPGDAFGRGAENCIRMPFAASMEVLQETVRRLQRILQ